MGWSESFFPDPFHHRVGEVVVSWYIKVRHLQLVNEPRKLIPLSVDLCGVGRVSFDHIPDAHYKLRLQKVDPVNAFFENAVAVAPGAIGYDDKLKLSRPIIDIQVRPGFGARRLFYQ